MTERKKSHRKETREHNISVPCRKEEREFYASVAEVEYCSLAEFGRRALREYCKQKGYEIPKIAE